MDQQFFPLQQRIQSFRNLKDRLETTMFLLQMLEMEQCKLKLDDVRVWQKCKGLEKILHVNYLPARATKTLLSKLKSLMTLCYEQLLLLRHKGSATRETMKTRCGAVGRDLIKILKQYKVCKEVILEISWSLKTNRRAVQTRRKSLKKCSSKMRKKLTCQRETTIKCL